MIPRKCLHEEKDQSSLWSTAGTLYQVLMDEERTMKFKLAISRTVREGDTVVDIGTGSGILSVFAAMAGAGTVYAIESDASNYRAANIVVRDNDMTDVVKVISGDAAGVELPEKADVVICELMSTALLDEPQIKLMNHAVNEFLKPNGKMIPKRSITYGEFVTADYHVYGVKLRVPQYEWSWIPSRSQRISEIATLSEIDFTTVNEEIIRCSGTLEIIQDGNLNGLRLYTKTYLTDEIVHCSSMGFCPRVVIPTREEICVSAGDTISYRMLYKAGYGYANIQLDVAKVKIRP